MSQQVSLVRERDEHDSRFEVEPSLLAMLLVEPDLPVGLRGGYKHRPQADRVTVRLIEPLTDVGGILS